MQRNRRMATSIKYYPSSRQNSSAVLGMKLLVLVASILPACLASVCSQVTTCSECDSIFDSDGDQSCEWCVKSSACVPSVGLECVFGTRITKKADCPKPIGENYQYDDTFARKIMMPLSGAAYSSNPQLCLTNAINGAELKRQLTVHCDSSKKDTCSGFTAVSHYHKAIIVSFRGTDGNMQLFLESIETVLDSTVAVLGGGEVSKYFYEAFKTLWEGGMMQDFVQLRTENPEYEVWVTGHSLGGAMASIAASVMVASKLCSGEEIKLVTFGQPRTGDHDFVEAHDTMLPYTYRITHGHDMVPHVPTRSYRGYHHHRYEVWYDNNMAVGSTYTLCLTPDDNECSDSNTFDLSIDDHLNYFGTKVSAFGENGCQS